MNTVTLNGMWKLYYAPEKNGKSGKYTPGMKNYLCVPGKVPGCAQLSLVEAGIESDPFFGENLHDFYQYEYYEWLYVRTFSVPQDWSGDRVLLRFDGIDTTADVYVNDRFAGHAANMMVEHVFDITELLHENGENELCVHIHSVMNEARNHEYTIGGGTYARHFPAAAAFGIEPSADETDYFPDFIGPVHGAEEGYDIKGFMRALEILIIATAKLMEVEF